MVNPFNYLKCHDTARLKHFFDPYCVSHNYQMSEAENCQISDVPDSPCNFKSEHFFIDCLLPISEFLRTFTEITVQNSEPPDGVAYYQLRG